MYTFKTDQLILSLQNLKQCCQEEAPPSTSFQVREDLLEHLDNLKNHPRILKHMICHFCSTDKVNFCSTQKCVNHDKTNITSKLTTKQILLQNITMQFYHLVQNCSTDNACWLCDKYAQDHIRPCIWYIAAKRTTSSIVQTKTMTKTQYFPRVICKCIQA